ncbi:MAG: ATP-binding protein [Fibrobacterota bacterium]
MFFVLIVSVAILSITVRQIRVKGKKDIERIWKNENLRVESTLREHVNIICSLLDAQYKSTLEPEQIQSFLDKVRSITYDDGRGYFWISRAGKDSALVMHPFADKLRAGDAAKVRQLSLAVDSVVQSGGSGFYRTVWPKFTGAGFSGEAYPKLCYAKAYAPLGWIVASGKYMDDVEQVIAVRSDQIRDDVLDIIRERILYSVVILSVFSVLIIFFSSRITYPINRLVTLSEEITSGKKDYASRMEVSSEDEIGRLAGSFNRLLSHIEQTLAKLEDNAAKYRELVENANSAIIRADKHGRILFFNEHAQKLFGYSPLEIQGKPISVLAISPAPVDGLDAGPGLNVVLQDAESNRYIENLCATKTGDKIWIAWSNKPLYDDQGRLRELLCVGSDITARKKAEELAQINQRKLLQTDKMATLGVMVSGIAHEINNPNNFILLNSENLNRFWHDLLPVIDDYYSAHQEFSLSGLPFSEARREMPGLIDGISEGAKRINRIVQGLKDFARQDTDNARLNINPKQLVEESAVIVGGLIKKTTDDFSIHQEGEVPDVRGNMQQLEQVVINLLTNACQATRDRSKSISISISFDNAARFVVIAVRDKGAGIKKEHMKHIMDPFFTTNRDMGGTGLGLSISYSIVKDHGGELKIESEPGRGTCASILLPAIS